jgi:DNA-binding response OmpR family regulator
VHSNTLTERRGSQSNERTQMRPGQPGRVLLLEDDEALRNVLSEVLTGERYQVETSRTFGELYRTATERRGDLALADFWGESMRELTDEERAQIAQLSRLIPVILMTAEQLGTRALLRKPFELEEMLATISATLTES